MKIQVNLTFVKTPKSNLQRQLTAVTVPSAQSIHSSNFSASPLLAHFEKHLWDIIFFIAFKLKDLECALLRT